jgi:hypothetical protein
MNYVIDGMRTEDWEQVRSIYLQGISTGHSTFETGAPDWDKWDSGHLPDHRLIARADNSILGWAALSPVSDRCVYSGVAELSLYVGAKHRGKGHRLGPSRRPDRILRKGGNLDAARGHLPRERSQPPAGQRTRIPGNRQTSEAGQDDSRRPGRNLARRYLGRAPKRSSGRRLKWNPTCQRQLPPGRDPDILSTTERYCPFTTCVSWASFVVSCGDALHIIFSSSTINTLLQTIWI